MNEDIFIAFGGVAAFGMALAIAGCWSVVLEGRKAKALAETKPHASVIDLVQALKMRVEQGSRANKAELELVEQMEKLVKHS